MFTNPHINEMMARATIDDRLRDAARYRGDDPRRTTRPVRRPRHRVAFARLRHSLRPTA